MIIDLRDVIVRDDAARATTHVDLQLPASPSSSQAADDLEFPARRPGPGRSTLAAVGRLAHD
jgi:hypothetical protein